MDLLHQIERKIWWCSCWNLNIFTHSIYKYIRMAKNNNMLLRCAFFYISILYVCFGRGTFILLLSCMAVGNLITFKALEKKKLQVTYALWYPTPRRKSISPFFSISLSVSQWDTSSKKQLRKSISSEHYFCRKSQYIL